MTGGENHLYKNQQDDQSRQIAVQGGNAAYQCTSCGNDVGITADICEHCKHWLKGSQCHFCYTEVKPGQKFCRECGNPPLGITCPNCNSFSHFDFCPQCNAPLSKRAKPYLEAMQKSPEFAELIQLSKVTQQEYSDTNSKAQPQGSTDPLDQLKAYLQKSEQPGHRKQAPGFSFENSNIDASDALEKASRQESILHKPDNSTAELELMKKIQLLQQQTFSDNQTARMFYTALKIMLPELIKTKEKRLTGWLCNFAGVIHAAPHECSEPNLGGEWQYETYTSYDTAYSEH